VPLSVERPSDLLELEAGTELGESSWIEISQDDIDTYADATRDHQWIHVDPERAAAGPFGSTIAHGYLTLGLVIPLWSELLQVENVGMAVNYGLNRLRFPAPVPVGSRIRLEGKVVSASEVRRSGGRSRPHHEGRELGEAGPGGRGGVPLLRLSRREFLDQFGHHLVAETPLVDLSHPGLGQLVDELDQVGDLP
jgi:acyl dehydratase